MSINNIDKFKYINPSVSAEVSTDVLPPQHFTLTGEAASVDFIKSIYNVSDQVANLLSTSPFGNNGFYKILSAGYVPNEQIIQQYEDSITVTASTNNEDSLPQPLSYLIKKPGLSNNDFVFSNFINITKYGKEEEYKYWGIGLATDIIVSTNSTPAYKILSSDGRLQLQSSLPLYWVGKGWKYDSENKTINYGQFISLISYDTVDVSDLINVSADSTIESGKIIIGPQTNGVWSKKLKLDFDFTFFHSSDIPTNNQFLDYKQCMFEYNGNKYITTDTLKGSHVQDEFIEAKGSILKHDNYNVFNIALEDNTIAQGLPIIPGTLSSNIIPDLNNKVLYDFPSVWSNNNLDQQMIYLKHVQQFDLNTVNNNVAWQTTECETYISNEQWKVSIIDGTFKYSHNRNHPEVIGGNVISEYDINKLYLHIIATVRMMKLNGEAFKQEKFSSYFNNISIIGMFSPIYANYFRNFNVDDGYYHLLPDNPLTFNNDMTNPNGSFSDSTKASFVNSELKKSNNIVLWKDYSDDISSYEMKNDIPGNAIAWTSTSNWFPATYLNDTYINVNKNTYTLRVDNQLYSGSSDFEVPMPLQPGTFKQKSDYNLYYRIHYNKLQSQNAGMLSTPNFELELTTNWEYSYHIKDGIELYSGIYGTTPYSSSQLKGIGSTIYTTSAIPISVNDFTQFTNDQVVFEDIQSYYDYITKDDNDEQLITNSYYQTIHDVITIDDDNDLLDKLTTNSLQLPFFFNGKNELSQNTKDNIQKLKDKYLAKYNITDEEFQGVVNDATAVFQDTLSEAYEYGGLNFIGIFNIANSSSNEGKMIKEYIQSKLKVGNIDLIVQMINDINSITIDQATESVFDSLDYSNELSLINNIVGPVVDKVADSFDSFSKYIEDPSLVDDSIATLINNTFINVNDTISENLNDTISSFSSTVDDWVKEDDHPLNFTSHQLNRSRSKLLSLAAAFLKSAFNDPAKALENYVKYIKSRSDKIVSSKLVKIINLGLNKIKDVMGEVGKLVFQGASIISNFVGSLTQSLMSGLLKASSFIDEVYNLLHMNELLFSVTQLPLANVPSFNPHASFLQNITPKTVDVTLNHYVSYLNNKYSVNINSDWFITVYGALLVPKDKNKPIIYMRDDEPSLLIPNLISDQYRELSQPGEVLQIFYNQLTQSSEGNTFSIYPKIDDGEIALYSTLIAGATAITATAAFFLTGGNPFTSTFASVLAGGITATTNIVRLCQLINKVNWSESIFDKINNVIIKDDILKPSFDDYNLVILEDEPIFSYDSPSSIKQLWFTAKQVLGILTSIGIAGLTVVFSKGIANKIDARFKMFKYKRQAKAKDKWLTRPQLREMAAYDLYVSEETIFSENKLIAVASSAGSMLKNASSKVVTTTGSMLSTAWNGITSTNEGDDQASFPSMSDVLDSAGDIASIITMITVLTKDVDDVKKSTSGLRRYLV